jgi:hypothetical protein
MKNVNLGNFMVIGNSGTFESYYLAIEVQLCLPLLFLLLQRRGSSRRDLFQEKLHKSFFDELTSV